MNSKSTALLFALLTTLCIQVSAQTNWKVVKNELVFKNPPFASCHASTIVEVTPDKFIASWFGGTEEGHNDVGIWLSTLEKGKWSKPVLMAEGVDKDKRYPCWNPVLFKSKEGKVFLFYKVGPSPEEWWGMVRTSTDNGKKWSAPQALPNGILGPIKNKPVQLPDGTILSPSSVEVGKNWKAHIERSKDLGKTWEKISIDPKSELNVIQPSILIYPDNKLQILCRSRENALAEAWSDDNGTTWTTVYRTSLPNPNSGTDAVTLKNGSQLLIYNPTIRGKGGRAKLNVAISKDGRKWEDIAIMENEEEGEFSYPAIIQATDGKVHITYTYNRNNVKYVVLEQN
jgi:predicted neuraminidase